ncbi:restriction endonuclease subunit S [uncultured Fusobacterium sp.]|uniref:restriction endonuclease subunit S n=1 Tax=uncultured Fusobacterium sp. TaxID=159267 RepID=UPI0025DB070A|nr:restriction endonuclease subunit S [uncultured Fusobacterium sp.]
MRKVPKLRFKEFSDEWEEKRLEDIGEINPKSKNIPEKFVYIDLESVVDGQLKEKKIIEKEEAPSRAKRLVEKNDILYQMVRPYQQNNLYFSFNDELDYVASTGYAQIRTFHNNSMYIYHLIHTKKFLDKVLERCTGTSYPAINSEDLAKISIKISKNINEQEKIANFLSSIDKKISLIEEKLELFREYKKGVIQKIFSQELRFKDSNGNNYPEWEEKKLGEILKEYYLGSNYKNSDKLSNFPLIKMGNLDRGKINLKKIEYIDIKENILEKDKLEYGTLLFNTRNTPELVGKVAIWKNELPQAYFNSNLMKMVFDNNFFMNYKFNTNDMIEKLKGIATGTTSVGAIYTKDLLKLVVVIPPSPEEQQKIADFLSSIDNKIESIEKELEELKEFKKGLLQQMFV